MRGVGRAKRTLRRLKRRFKPVAVILMYHRIMDVPVDPRGTAVSPENFARHLGYVQETCHPMHLSDLVEALRERSVPRRAVVVTFDDGHASILQRALPVLVSTETPATVFITTGSIDDSRSYWWDELDRLLLAPGRVPESLSLNVSDHEHRWHFDSWEDRLQAYWAIHQLARQATDVEREGLLSQLSSWSGIQRTSDGDCRPMTSAELVSLAQDRLVHLGAHTMTHPNLAVLPPDGQRAEILGSRSRLEAITGHAVEAFAYPYGQSEHFTDETVRIVQDVGFRVACTARQGLVEPGNDLLRLHRCEIQNWDLARFRKHLEWLFAS